MTVPFSLAQALIALLIVGALAYLLWRCDGMTFEHRRDTLLFGAAVATLIMITVALCLHSMPTMQAASRYVYYPDPCAGCEGIWCWLWGC